MYIHVHYIHTHELSVMTEPRLFFCARREREKDLMITKTCYKMMPGRTDVFTGVERLLRVRLTDGRRGAPVGPRLHLLFFFLPFVAVRFGCFSKDSLGPM